ncbi:unnamed protein product [Thelazia callipaeda]|uniref:AF4/FMR2 family member lilli n=1 Tax=Thelazia callipaeda TaxID=103827 RepID=A0A0N5CZQ6_THECL|nr:unnamed protein product [Thelazia callipaeda]
MIHPESENSQGLIEDCQPIFARIRENLVGGLGPFDKMADIIVNSQHGPNNSGLFGIVHSPIKPLRPTFTPSSSSTTSQSQLTAVQMAQKMQSIVDAPLSTIQTNLPFKKNQERKQKVMKGPESNVPSTSSINNTTDSGSNKLSSASGRSDDIAYKKRKRKRSDCNSADTENWQKLCVRASPKAESNDTKVSMRELFGEEKVNVENGKKQTEGLLKNTEKKILEQAPEEAQKSPDSGFSEEANENAREQRQPRVQSIIGEVSQISPLLTPPRQLKNGGRPTLPVIMNLGRLDDAQLAHILNSYKSNASSYLSAVTAPSSVLSPPVRPTSRNEAVTTCESRPSHPSDTKQKSKTTRSNTTRKSNVEAKISTTNHSKKDDSVNCSSSSADRSHELTTLKNDGLKIKLLKKSATQSEKTSSSPFTTSSTKESSKEKDSSSSFIVELAPNTRTRAPTPVHLKRAHAPFKKLTGHEQKKSAKECSEQDQQKIVELKDAKIKNEPVCEREAVTKQWCTGSSSDASNCGSQEDNTSVKGLMSTTSKDEKAAPAKRSRMDATAGSHCSAAAVQGDFVCCRIRTAPTRKAALDRNEDGSLKHATYYLEEVARPLKHRADKESTDHVRKTLGYMDAVVYFILSSAVEKENKQRQYAVVRDSAELMKTIVKWSSAPSTTLSQIELHFISRFRLLSSRVQAVLHYSLYSLKIGTFLSNFSALTKWESQLIELDAVAMRNDGATSVNSQAGSIVNTETPSPASSINSGHGERQKEMSVPVCIYQTQRSQLSILHHLMWSDRLWKQALCKISDSDLELIKHLDHICGPLAVDSSLCLLSEYIATAVAWLRAEYKSEKEQLSFPQQKQL